MKDHKSTNRGFTLLELLVTATLIAVLTIIGIVSYASVNKRSRDAKRRSDLEQMRSALEMYRSDNSQYPGGSGSGITDGQFNDANTLSTSLVSSKYMPSIPKDPAATNGSNAPSLYYYWPSSTTINGTTVYNGYCVCATFENVPKDAPGTCGAPYNLPNAQCNYGLKNP